MIPNLHELDELNYSLQIEIIERFRDINVTDDSWYEQIFSDFEDIGVVINKFDLYRGTVDVSFYLSIREVAKLAIDPVITHSLSASAKDFLESEPTEDNEVSFYLDLKEEILNVLRDKHMHLTSTREVAYTIMNNGFKFNKEGEQLI